MKHIIALIAVSLLVFACEEEKKQSTPEPAATEEAKPEEAKPEEAKPEEAKPEEAKPEEAKAEEAHAASCSCGAGKAGKTVWCDKCAAGYIKGEKTKDKAAVTAALAAGKKTE